MKKLAYILFFLCMAVTGGLSAQNITPVNIDAYDGDTVDLATNNIALYDDGGPQGSYSFGHDYIVTLITPCSVSDDTSLHFTISLQGETDIGCLDTLYFYDGGSISSPLMFKYNNCFETSPNRTFTVSPRNVEKMITVRMRTAPRADTSERFRGFQIEFDCKKACENIVVQLDTIYHRTDRNGNVLSTHTFTAFPEIDTIYHKIPVTNDSTGAVEWIVTDSVIRVDTTGWIPGATLCLGQGILLRAWGTYTHNTGWYSPHDSTSVFKWNFGDGDTVSEIYLTHPFKYYKDMDCYDVAVSIMDEHGCLTKLDATVQIRLAQNPMKTLFDLNPICNTESLIVNVGYEGENAQLTLKKNSFVRTTSKTNRNRQFIPDGRACGVPCYDTPVTFEEYGTKTVKSKDDICSICVNFEHSFMGDYSLSICCPLYDELVSETAYRAYLKHQNQSFSSNPEECKRVGTCEGGGMFTGIPFLNPTDGGGDGMCSGGLCDSINNPYGIGWNYCFSRNGDYTLVTGEPCNAPDPSNSGLAGSGFTQNPSTTFPPIPAGFCQAGSVMGPHSCTTKDSSDHINKTNYYLPHDDFSNLIGCPLNGTWNIKVCDLWPIDNGWVFSWSMDICGVSTGGGCEYQVGIDSVVWVPDTNYSTDFVDGVYRGLRIDKMPGDSTSSLIYSPDTAGDFKIHVKVYDEFSCVWDSLTRISTVYTPIPDLGKDTILCDVNTITLDATDRYTAHENYEFTWEPFGERTPTILTTPNTLAEHQYVVEVKNSRIGKQCVARDTIIISVNPQPMPNFDPGVYPLEGCEPFTININNTTTHGYKYRWEFGDGTYSTLKNPSHSYAAGTYDFKYYVESDKGCKDSLIYTDLITVHPSPKAAFTWAPDFPTVLHPSISLVNHTAPDNGNNSYFWEIQYDKNNPYSFHTLTDANPTFTWTPPATGEDVSGNYTIRLISRSDNRGLSGRLVQCADTVENNIVIINDNLIFPTVITPNGDGINDRFVILNLVEGLAYPNNALDIYDKWGSRVFHATNISRKDQFWDPSNGNIPTGTYFYRFSGSGYKGTIEHNGVVEVIK